MSNASRTATVWQSVLALDLYKRNAGKLVRQLTAAAIAIAIALGAWTMHARLLDGQPDSIRFGVPVALALAGAWFAFRIIHYPPFADFLIDVEGEMTKVSWPEKRELYKASVVVMTVMLLLSALLFGYDVLCQYFLRAIGVLQF